MKSLVGYTGFVGGNLARRRRFDGLYNSKNIREAFGTHPDILYYSGVPAEKFYANKFPRQDRAIVENALENMKKIAPKKVVLISSVDVYKAPNGRDEDSEMDTDGLRPYGANRLWLERRVEREFPEHLIVRLPGLYGKGIKKNFIFDYINFVPALLNREKFRELSRKEPRLKGYYALNDRGFWAVDPAANRKLLKEIFKSLSFSALNFTDSRGVFQYYNLEFLYKDIQIAIENGVKKLNIAPQPIVISELYKKLTGEKFENLIADNPPAYDFRTKHSRLFGRQDGYIASAEFCYRDIKKFVESELAK